VQIFEVAMLLPAVFLVRGISGYLNSYLFQVAGVRILEAIRLDYFRKLQSCRFHFCRVRRRGPDLAWPDRHEPDADQPHDRGQ